MFYRDSSNIYRARPLETFSWLVHGFGTRSSDGFGAVATLRQVHSDRIVLAAGRTGCLGEGDALIDNQPGTLLCVKTADCLPIVLVDARNRAVAAVHAGWRGSVQHITLKALKILNCTFGTLPEDVHAAFGPAIGKCCFEVGADVAARFGSTERSVDLLDYNRRQLIAAGVAPARIYAAGLCTVCAGDEFCSYRRERRQAGRMLSVVGILAHPE